MAENPILSLIVPTRQRPQLLRRMLTSLADTAARPECLEVVLVVDEDDGATRTISEGRLRIQQVIVPPGQTMGSLNMAGYEAARGRYLMLLNDDVIARTPGWDSEVRRCFAAYPDEILLVHVNDLTFQKHLCTFPVVSRAFCGLVGGICPREYLRYRIDDHIEDYFNMLCLLGERRVVYTPQVIFEHANFVENADGLRQYFSDPAVLGVDASLFEELLPLRKQAALRLMERIQGRPDRIHRWRRVLEGVNDSLALRTANRQRILTERGIVEPWDLEPTLWERVRRCARERGVRGVFQAARRRLFSLTQY